MNFYDEIVHVYAILPHICTCCAAVLGIRIHFARMRVASCACVQSGFMWQREQAHLPLTAASCGQGSGLLFSSSLG